MSTKDTKTVSEPLEVVASKIAEHADKSDQHVITAAMLIRDAKKRVEAGEAGDVAWSDWAKANIKLSPSRLGELQRIADAEDPAAELARIRTQTRGRVAAHRARKTSELEPERKALADWAREAPMVEVKFALDIMKVDYPGPAPRIKTDSPSSSVMSPESN